MDTLKTLRIAIDRLRVMEFILASRGAPAEDIADTGQARENLCILLGKAMLVDQLAEEDAGHALQVGAVPEGLARTIRGLEAFVFDDEAVQGNRKAHDALNDPPTRPVKAENGGLAEGQVRELSPSHQPTGETSPRPSLG